MLEAKRADARRRAAQKAAEQPAGGVGSTSKDYLDVVARRKTNWLVPAMK